MSSTTRIPKKKRRASGLTEKQEAVYNARILGFKFEDIAQSVGYRNASGAQKAFTKACQIMRLESRQELQMIAFSTYETLKNKFMNRALAGELKAAYFVAAMMDKQVELLAAKDQSAAGKGDGNTYRIIWDVPEEIIRQRERQEAERNKELMPPKEINQDANH